MTAERVIMLGCILALAIFSAAETWMRLTYENLFHHVHDGRELAPLWSFRMAWNVLAFPAALCALGAWCAQ